MPRRLTAVLLTGAALAFAACGGDDDGISGAPDPSLAGTQTAPTPEPAPEPPPESTTEGAVLPISKDLDRKPRIPKPEGEPPSELVVSDIVEGEGEAAETGDQVEVAYVGVSFSTGKQFDASWDREPNSFPFALGQGAVIPGWDQGVRGMKVGGRRELVIPADLAYGPQGQPPDIGPDETLVFVIDLKKIGGPA